MDAKPIVQSKTVWINSIVLVLSIVALVLGALQAGDLPTWFEVDEAVVALILSVVNLVLRFVTGQPLAMRLR